MPAPPSPRERAVAGLTWSVRGLTGFLLVDLITAAGLLAFVPIFNLPSPGLYQTGQVELTLTAFSVTLLALGSISGLLYAVGLAGLYGPRRELGRLHEASVGQTTLWLAVMLVLIGAGFFVPSLAGPFLTYPGIGYPPPSWAWSSSVMLAGLTAIFAGLTLYYAVQGLAEEDARVRLLLGMTIGVAGAVVWYGLAAYAAGLGGLSMGSLLPFLAGVVAGLGTSAISLGLFIAVYREIRRGLEAEPGTPA